MPKPWKFSSWMELWATWSSGTFQPRPFYDKFNKLSATHRMILPFYQNTCRNTWERPQQHCIRCNTALGAAAAKSEPCAGRDARGTQQRALRTEIAISRLRARPCCRTRECWLLTRGHTQKNEQLVAPHITGKVSYPQEIISWKQQ